MDFSLYKEDIHRLYLYYESKGRPNEHDAYLSIFSYQGNVVQEYFWREVAIVICNDTYQFDDYSKYVSTAYNAEDKERRRKEEFPKDRKRAFEMGVSLVL